MPLGIYDEMPGKFGEWNNATILRDWTTPSCALHG